ncbi:hypothetical protein [Butyrivibrio sp. AE3006]|nr:hypothetical protein [Butyrivibrio sp. AE3006]
MNTIEEVKKSSYSLYEALINKRDKLRKDALSYDREYVRVFGERYPCP